MQADDQMRVHGFIERANFGGGFFCNAHHPHTLRLRAASAGWTSSSLSLALSSLSHPSSLRWNRRDIKRRGCVLCVGFDLTTGPTQNFSFPSRFPPTRHTHERIQTHSWGSFKLFLLRVERGASVAMVLRKAVQRRRAQRSTLAVVIPPAVYKC